MRCPLCRDTIDLSNLNPTAKTQFYSVKLKAFYTQGNDDNAKTTLTPKEKDQINEFHGRLLNNLGAAWMEKKHTKKAWRYFKKSIEVTELKDPLFNFNAAVAWPDNLKSLTLTIDGKQNKTTQKKLLINAYKHNKVRFRHARTLYNQIIDKEQPNKTTERAKSA